VIAPKPVCLLDRTARGQTHLGVYTAGAARDARVRSAERGVRARLRLRLVYRPAS
jgi:hypothetical protein